MLSAFDALEDWVIKMYSLKLSKHQVIRIQLELDRYMQEHSLSTQSFIKKLRLNDKKTTQDMVDILTVQESYFFRDQSLFTLLKEKILPGLIAKRLAAGNKKLSIWSAGCARGEELYSVAIFLSQLIPDIHAWDIQLLGTDVNKCAIDAAIDGKYYQTALRSTMKIYQDNYFELRDNYFYLHEQIKQMASFECANVVEPVDFQHKFDFIFCRNLFIYLNELGVNKALKNFARALINDGKLFLGSSDFISIKNEHFTKVFTDGASYLIKKIDNDEMPRIDNQSLDKVKSERQELSYAENIKNSADILDSIVKLLQAKNYKEALEIINKDFKRFYTSALFHRYKAEALIGLGDTVTAREVLKESLHLDDLDPKAQFLFALLILHEDKELAMHSLKKAIYLHKKFPEAHHHLAMLYLADKNFALGIKHLNKAKNLAEQFDAERPIFGGYGSMQEYASIIASEISYYEGLQHE